MTRSRCLAAILASVLALLALLAARTAASTTPLTSPDESLHLRRAAQIAQGDLLPRQLGPNDWGGPLPSRLADLATWLDAKRNAGRPVGRADYRALSAALAHAPETSRLASFPSTASYPPIPYAGAAAGLALAGLLSPDPATALLSGRLGGLALSVLLAGLVIAILPFGRPAALMILTTPTALVLWASYSADPVTAALPLLFAALVLRLRQRPGRPLPRTALLALPALAIGLGLLKLTTALLALAVVLLPASRFASPRRASLHKALVVALAVVAALTWNLAYPFQPGRYWHSGADPARAVAFLLADPLRAIGGLGWNVVHRTGEFWITGWSAFGSGPAPYVFLQNGPAVRLAACLALAAALCDPPRSPDPVAATVLILLGSAYAIETMLAFRIGYTPPAWVFITGLQGRYFLPAFALLLLGLACLARRRSGPPATAAGLVLLAWSFLDWGAIDTLVRDYRPLFH